MTGNRGTTTLKRRRHTGDPMREFDRMPPDLRAWLARAILPWRPKSALRAYHRAVARTRDPARALEELDRLQARLVARDARRIWGPHHPCAAPDAARASKRPPASSV